MATTMVEVPRGAVPEQEAIVCRAACGRTLSPEVAELLTMSPEEAARLYRQRDPDIQVEALSALLRAGSRHFKLSGVDFLRTDKSPGFVALETNSAPGFAYCTPGNDAWEWAYLRTASWFAQLATDRQRNHLALLTESKLPCETVGFAAALSQTLGYQVPVYGPRHLQAATRGERGELRIENRSVLGGLRYLHDAPWRWLPPDAPGCFVNGTAVDLAGGRDKVAAFQAYESFDRQRRSGIPALSIPRSWVLRSPQDLERLPADCVVKAPRLNSGEGIDFLAHGERPAVGDHDFPRLGQALIWPVGSAAAGEVRQRLIDGFVHDLRVVVGSGPAGFFPLMIYSRQARLPYQDGLQGPALKAALTTNIAVPQAQGGHRFEYQRLVFPTRDGWDHLALDAEDFAVMFIQAALATLAIDDAVEFGRCVVSVGC